ncbi:MAG: type II secretion system F family protein [Tepidisphaeraceae bacterium]|jgi:tight adherence protein C
MDPATILSICTFGFVSALAYFASTLFNGENEEKLRTRLKSNQASAPSAAPAAPKVPLLTRFGQAAARPFMPTTRERISSTRRNLGYAGIYSPSAVKTLFGFKFIFLVVGLCAGYVAGVVTGYPFVCLPFGALAGLFAPVMWLKTKIKANQQALDYGLPDALDLLVVCVESGLTLDAAMQRVGQEMAHVHPALSRELGITHMETRVGITRVQALRNLGSRTGSTALQSLSAMLMQAERFGTSIAQALRVHAESLRLARQHKAEEVAAKTTVKLSFPLVLFIFPATFLVLIGPTAIHLMNSPLFK